MSVDPSVAATMVAAPALAPEEQGAIDAVLVETHGQLGATMLVLTLVQERVGYISLPMQTYIAQKLQIPLSHLYGVLTFYSSFRMQPIGRHKVSVCLGTACYVRNGPMVVEKLQQLLGVKLNETTPDNRFTLEICRCVGACSQAPVVMIDDDIAGRVNPADISKILKKYA